MTGLAEQQTCDFVIVGGGAAGCIIARRLAERSHERIILLEAGKSDENDPAALLLSHLDDQTDDYDWGFAASTLPGGPASLNYSRARLLGGCTNHNDCAFLIPPDSDFAEWESRGARGWNAEALRPYFRRVEERVSVYQFEHPNPVSRAFVDAGRELGLPLVDFRQNIVPGVGWFPLNSKGDRRSSASVAYLHPMSALPRHLEVWTETTALRLIVEDGRAVGVETSRGRIIARREVILTAGALQTPQLMMLSGIGPAAELRKLGIAVALDRPGVGKNLRDHVAAPVVWSLNSPVPTWDYTPFEAVMLARLEDDQPAPDVLYHFGLRLKEKYGDHPRYSSTVNGVKASPNVTRARSTGRVCLVSADPRAKPLIELNYLSDPEGYDLRVLLKGLRFARKLAGTEALGRLILREDLPGPSAQSDDELAAFAREACETVYHASGTAAMGDPAHRDTVVDPALGVVGMKGLRVCDASVFPSMVTVNIANTVMMVAEKAADHILGTQR
jgi:choline oxidase